MTPAPLQAFAAVLVLALAATASAQVTDGDILNFALQLEYLEGEVTPSALAAGTSALHTPTSKAALTCTRAGRQRCQLTATRMDASSTSLQLQQAPSAALSAFWLLD